MNINCASIFNRNPNISDELYPDLTWAYIKKVPALIAILIAAGIASNRFTRNRDAGPGKEEK